MSTKLGIVICSDPECVFSNVVFSSNAVVDQTVDRPELSHLRLECGWCGAELRAWANQETLNLARELGFEVDQWFFLRRKVVESYARVQWVHELGREQEADITALGQQLEQSDLTDWKAELQGDVAHGSSLPATWSCDCGSSTGCQPQLIVVGEMPLRTP